MQHPEPLGHTKRASLMHAVAGVRRLISVPAGNSDNGDCRGSYRTVLSRQQNEASPSGVVPGGHSLLRHGVLDSDDVMVVVELIELV